MKICSRRAEAPKAPSVSREVSVEPRDRRGYTYQHFVCSNCRGRVQLHGESALASFEVRGTFLQYLTLPRTGRERKLSALVLLPTTGYRRNVRYDSCKKSSSHSTKPIGSLAHPKSRNPDVLVTALNPLLRRRIILYKVRQNACKSRCCLCMTFSKRFS